MERKEILSEEEYDIMDELYFVTSFGHLQEETGFSDAVLQSNLTALIDKEFVKVYTSMDEEALPDELNIQQNFKAYFYLASKKGLFEHNSR